MSNEIRDDDDGVIVKERARLTGYIGRTGLICLKQVGVEQAEDEVILIHANDVDAVIHALTDLQEQALTDSTRVE